MLFGVNDFATIPLKGLTTSEVVQLVRQTGCTPDGYGVAELMSRSGGNPLYLRFALGSSLRSHELPDSLNALFGAILSQLAAQHPRSLNALRLLAEIDEPLAPPAIANLARLPENLLISILDPRLVPFVAEDASKPNHWSTSHDLVREYLRSSSFGAEVPAFLCERIPQLTAYQEPVCGCLVRHGIKYLLNPNRRCPDRDATEQAIQLAELLKDASVLDMRLDHQSPEDLLRDANLVAAALGDGNLRHNFIVAFSAFVLAVSDRTPSRLLPEHFQMAYLRGELNVIYQPLLNLLCDQSTVRSVLIDRDSASLVLMAFSYCRASVMRRSLDPTETESAWRTLTEALELAPAAPPATLIKRYARERARIYYDIGYIAYLRGSVDEALNAYRMSADAAEDGVDEVGVWAVRCLEIQALFLDRRQPGWLAQAGLWRAAERLSGLPLSTPHSARWIVNAQEHGFEAAFRERQSKAPSLGSSRCRRTLRVWDPDQVGLQERHVQDG